MPTIDSPWIRALLGTTIVVALLVGLPLAAGSLVDFIDRPGLLADWLEGYFVLMLSLAVLLVAGGLLAIGIWVGEELFG